MCVCVHAHEEVLGFDVAVNDAARVQVEERAREVRDQLARAPLGELGVRRDRVEQVAALRSTRASTRAPVLC